MFLIGICIQPPFIQDQETITFCAEVEQAALGVTVNVKSRSERSNVCEFHRVTHELRLSQLLYTNVGHLNVKSGASLLAFATRGSCGLKRHLSPEPLYPPFLPHMGFGHVSVVAEGRH
uniref:Uncharacterized protein n=1 Tax=Knipowitschia caucasica TaxID=637954 RepID=A0AAV2JZJ4_KNICA